MIPYRVALAVCLSALLSGCSSFQPKQISLADLRNGMPPLTGTLPNGVIANNPSK